MKSKDYVEDLPSARMAGIFTRFAANQPLLASARSYPLI